MNGLKTDTRYKVQVARLKPCNLYLAPRTSKGFTLIELIVVILIILLLTGSLLSRIWFYQEQAEKAAMEQVAAAVQSAIVLQYGQMMTHGNEGEVKNMVLENPLNWLMQKPPNYAGEFFAMTPASIPAGNWAFDLRTRELIYVPYRTYYFTAGKDGNKWVRFRAHLVYEVARGSKSKGRQELASLLFEPAEPYHWFVKDEK